MKRRQFLAATLATAGVAGTAAMSKLSAAEKDATAGREFYELRRYQQRRGSKTRVMDDYWRDAALPALKRAGVGPVGVFTVLVGPDAPSLYVLIPHRSIESLVTLPARLAADRDYTRAGADYFALPPTEPAYIRLETSLLLAFEGIPRLEVPAAAAGNKARIFELRTYESHNERAAKKKIEMFNTGEIAIFRKNGLQPVFFGETLVGTKMPNLTYMLTFENMAAREKNFASFAADPDWKKLSTTPGYTDPEIVTNINNVFLRPAPYSEI